MTHKKILTPISQKQLKAEKLNEGEKKKQSAAAAYSDWTHTCILTDINAT